MSDAEMIALLTYVDRVDEPRVESTVLLLTARKAKLRGYLKEDRRGLVSLTSHGKLFLRCANGGSQELTMQKVTRDTNLMARDLANAKGLGLRDTLHMVIRQAHKKAFPNE
tara:strand:+ start:748 stop:1080 length:333 start_codon:yes stop_codon:yes gene_type:complete